MEKLSLNQESTWHVLYTRHQCERRVEQRLIQKGFETFLPLYHTTHRWKDRMKPLDLPLFPSYVFIRGGVDRRLDLITTSDVAFIVGDSSGPGTIAAEEIDAIRLLVSTHLNVEPHPFLEVGDRVRVTDGPLEGLEGILVRRKEPIPPGRVGSNLAAVRCRRGHRLHAGACEFHPPTAGSLAAPRSRLQFAAGDCLNSPRTCASPIPGRSSSTPRALTLPAALAPTPTRLPVEFPSRPDERSTLNFGATPSTSFPRLDDGRAAASERSGLHSMLPTQGFGLV